MPPIVCLHEIRCHACRTGLVCRETVVSYLVQICHRRHASAHTCYVWHSMLRSTRLVAITKTEYNQSWHCGFCLSPASDPYAALLSFLPPSFLHTRKQVHLETWQSEMQAAEEQGEEASGVSTHDGHQERQNGRDTTLRDSETSAGGALHGILVFLPGQEDIESLAALIRERAGRLPPGTPPLAVAPIFAALPTEQQMRVFRPSPPGTRKVRPAPAPRMVCCCSASK